MVRARRDACPAVREGGLRVVPAANSFAPDLARRMLDSELRTPDSDTKLRTLDAVRRPLDIERLTPDAGLDAERPLIELI
jgi:hypothetical protein